MKSCLLRWHKCSPNAVVPTKTPSAAGLDLYTVENNIILKPHSQYLFSTGLAVVIEEGGWLQIVDRGSTGSKGLHVHCGIVDNDYRGEIFVCIKNDNPYPVHFNDIEEPGIHFEEGSSDGRGYDKYLVYSTKKAIAQIIPIPQPEVSSGEATEEEGEVLKNTARGEGKLGSSGK